MMIPWQPELTIYQSLPVLPGMISTTIPLDSPTFQLMKEAEKVPSLNIPSRTCAVNHWTMLRNTFRYIERKYQLSVC